MKKLILYPLCFFACLSTAGCASLKSEHVPFNNANSPTTKQQYLLDQTLKRLQNKNLIAAQQSLKQVDFQTLSDQQKIIALSARAEIDLINHKPKLAIEALQQAEASDLVIDPATYTYLKKMYAKACFMANDLLCGLTMGTRAWRDTPLPKQQKYLTHLWKKLLSLNSPQLLLLKKQAKNEIQQGWIDLTLMAKNNNTINEMQQSIEQWHNRYSNHPSANLVNNNGFKNPALAPLPKKIVILLPLNGAIGKQSEAIRNGFFAAYYQARGKGYAPIITVYDTSQKDIVELYKKAVLKEQADMVIGPLLKKNIESLILRRPLTTPTIVLNTVPTGSPTKNLFQFGLSPENEAEEVAKRMWQDQHTRVLIIEPNSLWGQRVGSSFSKTWKQLGGKVTAFLDYQVNSRLSWQLKQLLNLDASIKRGEQIKKITHQKIRFIPRRRQDFDAIFLVATPAMGGRILPLLRFYYANNTAVYSISEIYRGYPSQREDRDLNQTIFDDIPWLYTNPAQLPPKIQSLKDDIESAWPASSKSYTRFYALGIDAFQLMTQRNKFHLFTGFGINSATGTLFLKPNGQVYRKLIFNKMKNGNPQLFLS